MKTVENTKCHTQYDIVDKEPEKKKRGHGYTKPLCKKAKAKRKRKGKRLCNY